MVLEALEKAHEDGGVGYLLQQATTNPNAFMTLVGKVLPLTVNASVSELTHEQWLASLK